MMNLLMQDKENGFLTQVFAQLSHAILGLVPAAHANQDAPENTDDENADMDADEAMQNSDPAQLTHSSFANRILDIFQDSKKDALLEQDKTAANHHQGEFKKEFLSSTVIDDLDTYIERTESTTTLTNEPALFTKQTVSVTQHHKTCVLFAGAKPVAVEQAPNLAEKNAAIAAMPENDAPSDLCDSAFFTLTHESSDDSSVIETIGSDDSKEFQSLSIHDVLGDVLVDQQPAVVDDAMKMDEVIDGPVYGPEPAPVEVVTPVVRYYGCYKPCMFMMEKGLTDCL